MSNRDISLYIVDVLIAIDKINRYTSNIDNSEELLHSEMEWDATIRELQIIGDATNNIMKLEILDISFRKIVDFRNQIVHGYFGIDEDIVWDVVKNKILILYTELIKLIKSKNIDIMDAIEAAKLENQYNSNTTTFLNQLIDEL